MIKTVPLEQVGDIKTNEIEDLDSEVDSLFESLAKETPKYWPLGLSKGQFNGIGDKIYIINDNGKAAGFIGFQRYRPDENTGGMKTVVSVGFKPDYRGKGYAKKHLISLAKENYDHDEPLAWNCHKDNDGSLRLYGSLVKSKLFDNIRLKLDD